MIDDVATREKIEALGPWFHNLHLADGIQTAPNHFLGDFPNSKWRQIEPYLQSDLTGRRVLDIGCNAGFYSLALASRGAEVLGIDTEDRYLEQARWAASLSGEKRVRYEKASVYEIPLLDGDFDIVLFMGVFYHLRHPLLALDLIAELEPDLFIFQTLTRGDEDIHPLLGKDVNFQSRTRLQEEGWPAMAFVESTFCGDPTNWWIPNHACVLSLLKSAGFSVTAYPGHEIYLCDGMDRGGKAYVDEAHRSAWSIARQVPHNHHQGAKR